MRSMVLLLTVSLVALGWIASPGAVRGDELSPAVLKKVRSATVFIKVTRPEKEPRGSGFLISQELIVTNAHVLGVAENEPRLPSKIEVVLNSGTSSESVVDAQALAVNLADDLAYLKIPRRAGSHFLTLRPSSEIVETMPVSILGFPLGEGLDLQQRNPAVTISAGHVSSLRRNEEQQISEIQIDGSLIPGNSGGPIIDAQGELVGVSASAIVGLKIGFSIPGDMVQADLEGRIDSVDYEYEPQGKGLYTIKASAKTVDPLRRIKRLALYYWTGRPGSERPLDAQGKFGTYGAPDDGPRKHVELTLDKQTGLWTGQIAKFAMQPDQNFWTQPAIATAKGVRRSPAADHAEYLRQADEAGKSVASPKRPLRGARRSRRGRLAPGQLPQDPEPSEIAKELAQRFKYPRPPVVAPEPVAPSAAAALPATQQRESGYPYALVQTRTRVISLGEGKLIQMAADPSGSRLFAIHEGQSKVSVFDPVDMTLQQEIRVAQSPVSIWCDAERLVVACRDARAVLIFDMKNLKAIKAVETDDPRLMPLRIVGRARDGSFMTLWGNNRDALPDCALYLVDEGGGSLRVITHWMEWCALPDGNFLLAQKNSSAEPEFISFKGPFEDERLRNEFFDRHGISNGDSFRIGFLSEDGKRFLLPAARRRAPVAEAGGTLVLTPDLKTLLTEVPGSVICEYSAANCYIALGANRHGDPSTPLPEIRYIERSSGRITRKVIVEGDLPSVSPLSDSKDLPNFVFIPGHELLLVHGFYAERSEVTLVRCGPILPDADSGIDQPTMIGNLPPKSVTVGKTVVFTPGFTPPAGASEVVFRLAEGVSGMEIGPATGKISFTPNGDNLGVFDIAVVADVDGKQVPVITWRLEIVMP